MSKSKAKKPSAGGDRVVKATASRLLIYAPPWCLWVLLPLLSGAGYLLWGRKPTVAPWFSMAAFGLVIGLVWWVWKLLAARDQMLQWLGTLSTAAGGMWFIIASLISPLAVVVLNVWGLFGFGCCVFWTIRRAVLSSNTEQGAGGGGNDRLTKVLDGARIQRPKEVEGRVVAAVEVDRGSQTIGDLQKRTQQMAGVLGVRPEAVRITQDPDDAGRGSLTIVPNDPLQQTITWPGPSAPGSSIHDAPIPVGVYEDGVAATIWLTGDDEELRALAHWLFMGVTRAGKSQFAVMAFADALSRCDVVILGSDHVKGKQTFGPIAAGLARMVTTLKGAREMITAVRGVVRARADDMGERGYDQWAPGCGFPLLIVWIEEAAEVVTDSDSFVRLVQQAGSTGVVIVASMQRASHDNIDTSARAQLTGTACFGVRDYTDASFALPDEVLDAGAKPEAWGNRKPGYAYLVAPGIDEDRWATPLRTFRASRDQVEAAVADWAHVRADLDDLSKAATGGWWERSANPDTPARQAGEQLAEVDGDLDNFDDEDGLTPMPAELAPELKVDPDAPIGPPPPGADLPLGTGQPARKLTTEQARGVVQQHLRALLDQGNTHTQPADLARMKPQTGRTREWVRLECIRLCDEPTEGEIALARDNDDEPGVYRITALVAAIGGDPA